MRNNFVVSNLLLFGFTHAVVDATCAGLIVYLLKYYPLTSGTFIGLVILYNLLAFGLQPLIGIYVDKWKIPRNTAMTGVITTAISAISILFSPILAVILAGIGNALFHVGAGTISLNLTPKKATAPGIFVAPGALGLLVGTLLSKGGYFIPWIFITILLLLCIGIYFIAIPKIDYTEKIISNKFSHFELIIILILLAIVVRALIGSLLVFPWKADIMLLIILTFAVVFGKALGGILADKFGWTLVSISALIISAPLLAFGANIPVVAIIGIFLFNITMPVTLVVISNTLPGKPGFAFGLTTLALIFGALPVFTELKNILNNTVIILIAILISAMVLFFGLKFYSNVQSHSNKK